VKALHKIALSAKYWTAMTLNGFAYSAVLGYDPSIAIDALEAGAVAAGLSGKGPAVAAVVSEERAMRIKGAWKKYDGEIIETTINREKAHILR